MKTFKVRLKGFEPGRSDRCNLVKRVNAPSRERLDSLLTAYGLRRWLDTEPKETTPRQEQEGVDAALSEEGTVVWIADARGTPMTGFTLARRWRKEVCLAAVSRRPEEVGVLLAELIELIDGTGGLTTDELGTEVPVADEWPDLAVLYMDACRLVQIAPKQKEDNDDA